MAVSQCNICDKCINTNSKSICCNICKNVTHLKCSYLSPSDCSSDYTCTSCISSIFPFNYVSEETEFLSMLLNFFEDFPLFNNHDLNGPRLSILNNINLLDDRDRDVDVNLYKTCDADSKYYLPDTVRAIPELKANTPHLSVFHLNARSMLKNGPP